VINATMCGVEFGRPQRVIKNRFSASYAGKRRMYDNSIAYNHYFDNNLTQTRRIT
jgi:hypothetical protein